MRFGDAMLKTRWLVFSEHTVVFFFIPNVMALFLVQTLTRLTKNWTISVELSDHIAQRDVISL